MAFGCKTIHALIYILNLIKQLKTMFNLSMIYDNNYMAILILYFLSTK